MNGSAAEIISVDIEGNGNFEFKEPIAPTSDIDAFGNDVCLRIKQYPSSPSQLCCIRTSAAVPAQFSWNYWAVQWQGMYLDTLWGMGDEGGNPRTCTHDISTSGEGDNATYNSDTELPIHSFKNVCQDISDGATDFYVTCGQECLYSVVFSNIFKLGVDPDRNQRDQYQHE